MAEWKHVLAFGETAEGTLAPVTAELLGCGRELADDLHQELAAVLIGNGVGALAHEAVRLGADRVYLLEDPLLAEYHPDSYATVMEQVIGRLSPGICLFGQTPLGRDLAPRLAFRMRTAATLDCIRLSIDPASKRLLQTKPVFGGNAFATYTCQSNPQIAALRVKTMSPPEPDDARSGEVIALKPLLDPSAVRTKILERVPEVIRGTRLEDARVVVSGGRGIGSLEGFRQLEELAGLLNGAVGATRSSCDNGWVSDSRQIGLTGKIVTPDLYIAIAISGASQHLTGIAGQKTIVAINKDAYANIFKEARFGIVGDWERVVPAFMGKIRELLLQ